MSNMLDPMYTAFQKDNPNVSLVEYGFYEDNVHSYDWGTNIILTPEEIRVYQNVSNPAVLVMTGALDPFHAGHDEALRIVHSIVEQQGYSIIYTHVVPDNISYARSKRPMGYSTDGERINNIMAYGYSPDLACVRYDGCPNFTSTLLYVSQFWGSLGVYPTIFNVLGGDNGAFAEVVKAYDPVRFGSIIVDRDGTDNSVRHDPESNVFVYSDSREYAELSSTMVRSSEERYTLHKPVMFIKNDLSYYTSDKNFAEELLSVLQDAFISYGYHVKIYDYEKQIRLFTNMVQQKYQHVDNVEYISLDTHIPLGQTYNIHRVFNHKHTKIGYTHDGTRPSITPNGKYVLLDDDIATGDGIQYVREYVEKRGGIVAGVETIFTHEGTFDVLDASDVTTIQDTGLVISSSLNNPIKRVPYLHPHIPLDKFASVPRKHAIEFTESVINILKKYKVGIYS